MNIKYFKYLLLSAIAHLYISLTFAMVNAKITLINDGKVHVDMHVHVFDTYSMDMIVRE